MRTRVKICGITRLRDARAALDAGADAIGFVFWPGSPRRITPTRAAAIASRLPALLTKVGVFVNASPAEVARVVKHVGLDAVQLHGEEDPAAFSRAGAAVIKTVAPVTRADVARALRLPRDVTVLVDVHDRARRGGTGRRANWRMARAIARRRPILLAGGLRAANVRDAILSVAPWGLDVSSGVEREPGIKDPKKIHELLGRVGRLASASGDR